MTWGPRAQQEEAGTFLHHPGTWMSEAEWALGLGVQGSFVAQGQSRKHVVEMLGKPPSSVFLRVPGLAQARLGIKAHRSPQS